MITAGGYGSRLSLRSAGTTIAWSERSTNLRLYEISAGAISLLRIVIYNEFCNCNVSVAFERSNSLHSDVVERAHAARCVVV
jgi:hypothetical protein